MRHVVIGLVFVMSMSGCATLGTKPVTEQTRKAELNSLAENVLLTQSVVSEIQKLEINMFNQKLITAPVHAVIQKGFLAYATQSRPAIEVLRNASAADVDKTIARKEFATAISNLLTTINGQLRGDALLAFRVGIVSLQGALAIFLGA